MKLKHLFFMDMRFQAKYGFYFLYAVLTVLYVRSEEHTSELQSPS